MVSVFVVLCLASVGVLVETTAARRLPVPYRAADLPRLVHDGKVRGPIRVLLRFPAVPTADPLVWEYRPSLYGTLPPSIVFRFQSPPLAPFTVVEGESVTMSYDLLRRKGDVPGFVVVSACSVP